MFELFGFLFFTSVCVWMGVVLTNVRATRKAVERSAAAVEYQSNLMYETRMGR